MIFLIFLALNLSNITTSELLNNTTALSSKFQKKCNDILPTQQDISTPLASLICGEKITDQDLAQNLSESSLIHLFVISGSHLLLLDELLSILSFPLFVRSWILLSYTLVAGWQPPVVRALFGWGLRKFPTFQSLHLPTDLVVLFTGLFTLALFPDWIESKSLLMSWCASLALTVPGTFKVRGSLNKILLMQICIFIFMIPCLWGFGSLHPLGLLFNLLLGPAVGFLLIPLGALAIVAPSTGFLFSGVLTAFNELMRGLTDPIVLPKGEALSVEMLWLWVIALHCSLHALRLLFRQGQDFER
jgi:ComEC/Rec2-related protein